MTGKKRDYSTAMLVLLFISLRAFPSRVWLTLSASLDLLHSKKKKIQLFRMHPHSPVQKKIRDLFIQPLYWTRGRAL